MLWSKNQQQQLPVVQSNVFGMTYGAAMMAVLALAQGIMPVFDSSLSFNLSLLYLSLFGSVLAFGAYLTLVGRIGPAKAAYTMVLFPIVALGISTLFEELSLELVCPYWCLYRRFGKFNYFIAWQRQLKASCQAFISCNNTLCCQSY